MGIYKISEQEIYNAVNDCLDTLEGDFDKKTLHRALDEVKKEYKYTSDNFIIPVKVKQKVRKEK